VSSKFCVNKLLHSFLISAADTAGDQSQDASNPSSSVANEYSAYKLTGDSLSKSSQANQQEKGFIIVESNFKVYAYTNSELHQAILRLFMREDFKYPNLVVGRLTRDSLKEAFNKKITA
jgi:transcription initiation factor TFIIH subunit 4